MSALARFERLNIGKLQKLNAQQQAAYSLARRYRSRLTNSNRNKLINKFFSNNININKAARAINNAVPPGTFRTRPGRFRQYLQKHISGNSINTQLFKLGKSQNAAVLMQMAQNAKQVGNINTLQKILNQLKNLRHQL